MVLINKCVFFQAITIKVHQTAVNRNVYFWLNLWMYFFSFFACGQRHNTGILGFFCSFFLFNQLIDTSVQLTPPFCVAVNCLVNQICASGFKPLPFDFARCANILVLWTQLPLSHAGGRTDGSGPAESQRCGCAF